MVTYVYQSARSGVGAFVDKEFFTQYDHRIKSWSLVHSVRNILYNTEWTKRQCAPVLQRIILQPPFRNITACVTCGTYLTNPTFFRQYNLFLSRKACSDSN